MAVTEVDSGSQTATLTTEHTLSTKTAAGVYVLVVDTSALVNGETLTLRIKTKCRTGDTERLAYEQIYQHAQYEPNKYSVPVPITFDITATLRQDGGTGRAFPWALLTL